MADGKGCKCYAHCECECVCGADWTPQEVIDIRQKLADSAKYLRVLVEALKIYANDREWLKRGHWRLEFNSSHADDHGFVTAQKALASLPAHIRGDV